MTSGLTYEQAVRVLRYEPETGKLFWLYREPDQFKTASAAKGWNSHLAGRPALNSRHTFGYLAGYVFGRPYLVHRVAWLLSTGSWPVRLIDHIDGDGTNNRLGNLRDVASSINQRNTKRRSDNTSGVTGVRWDAARSKWVARIYVDGRNLFLGRFNQRSEAVAVRQAASGLHGFTARHGSVA